MLSKIKSLLLFYKFEAIVIFWRVIVLKFYKKILRKESLRVNVNGYSMILPLQQGGLTDVLYIFKSRELDHKLILEKVMKKGDVVLDLGANIGYYALLEKEILNGDIFLYCIEPDIRNIKYLNKNIQLHNIENITEVSHGAISDYNGTINIVLEERTNLNAISKNPESSSNVQQVPCFSVVDYMSKRNNIDLIRMDIEGHEMTVFSDLLNGIENGKIAAPRVIVFETHKYDDIEGAAAILNRFVKCGYTFTYISSDDELLGENSTFKLKGLVPERVIDEWTVSRGVYENVETELAIDLVSNWKGTRTVCMEVKGD